MALLSIALFEDGEGLFGANTRMNAEKAINSD
jgi:hypothetical protein